MKCTDCSTQVKPVVALDIDGTLADYHQHFCDFASEYWDDPSYQYTRYRGTGKLRAAMGMSQEAYEQTKLAYRQGGMKRSIPVFSGAVDLAHAIRSTGAEVWITTTRPYLRLDGIDPDTRFWLQRHDIHYDYLLYDSDKYRILFERVERDRVIAVVDDLREQLLESSRYFGSERTIMRLNRWNLDNVEWARMNNIKVFDDLSDLRQSLTRKIKEWYERG